MLIINCLRLVLIVVVCCYAKACMNFCSGSLVHVSSTSLYLFLSDFLVSMDRKKLHISSSVVWEAKCDHVSGS